MVCTSASDCSTAQDEPAQSPADRTYSHDDEVWREYFDQRDQGPRRRSPWWLRILGAVIAFAVLGSGITAAVQAVRYLTRISEPEAIVEHAQGYVDKSPFGFLVTRVETAEIEEPNVGAFVRANPADGVVTIDIRPWEGPGLDRIMAHEIGHLVDFALSETLDEPSSGEPGTIRRGGLSSEVWAECAAVAAGERNLDDSSASKEYRCTDEELDVFESVMDDVDTLCVPWRSETPCWSLQEG